MRLPSKKTTIIIGALITCLLVSGIAFAYMFRRSSEMKNEFVLGNVDCIVIEPKDTTASGETQKTSITVKNTGNTEAYLRVRLVSYWVQEKNGATEIVAKPSVMPEFSVGDGWLKGDNDTFYYKKPVDSNSPNRVTGNLLKSPLILSQEGGYKQVVEVFAEAIQSMPTEAVIDSWSVSLDNNRNIVTVK